MVSILRKRYRVNGGEISPGEERRVSQAAKPVARQYQRSANQREQQGRVPVQG